jgi:hypothetical protein
MSSRSSTTLKKSERGGKQMEDQRASRRWMYGNPSVSTCAFRTSNEPCTNYARLVAVGAEEPLAEHMMVADFFRKYTTSHNTIFSS